MAALYVYAFTKVRPVRLGRGFHGEVLRGVRVGALWSVVGEIDAVPAVTPRVLRAHDRTVRELFRRLDPLLPARFGSVVSSEKELRASVLRQAEALRAAVAQVRGCEQMNVRIFGAPSARPAASQHKGLGEGARYLHQRLDSERWRRSLPELAPLRLAVSEWIRAERNERQERPPLIGTAHHLVPRGSARGYRKAARKVVSSVSPWRVEVSGPFPPYAFAPEATA